MSSSLLQSAVFSIKKKASPLYGENLVKNQAHCVNVSENIIDQLAFYF